MSNALQLSALCNRQNVPVLEQPQLIYVLAEVTPGSTIANVRLPLNFTLVLDRSGSMAGEKLETMREAVKAIIDQLSPSDVISIVTFENKTQVLVPAQSAADRAGLKGMVDNIKDGGGTVMAPAIREGLNQVSQFASPAYISRIVLLTDGEATDKFEASMHEADNAGARGIPIIGMGFGSDWKEDFLQEVADRSWLSSPGSDAGRVEFIRDPGSALQVFQEVLQSMHVVAQDVTVNVRMVQGLEARRVWQVVPLIKEMGTTAIQGRSVVIPVGDLEQGGAAYMVEMMLPPRPAGNVRIAQVDAAYNLPQSGPQREAVDLVINFTHDASLAGQLNGHVMNIVEKVTAFRLQTQALRDAEMGNVSGATQRLRQAVTMLINQGEHDLAQQMEAEARNLEEGKGISGDGAKTIRLTSRKTVRLDD
ncbi:MAG: VWA domain-containing protein [Anaerolineae bacterium]|nr:VWA domain-containing protein [Anaerolineae bacterium]